MYYFDCIQTSVDNPEKLINVLSTISRCGSSYLSYAYQMLFSKDYRINSIIAFKIIFLNDRVECHNTTGYMSAPPKLTTDS